MDDDDNVNNDDLMLGFCCGGAGGSVFFRGWLIIDVSEALFRLCRGTNIYTLLGCDRISGHVPWLFILYIFSYLCGFLYCWCERNTGRHFIGFYFKNRIKENKQHIGIKTLNTATTRQNKWQAKY